MITTEYLDEMAAFARWLNDRLYEHCEEIGPEERDKDRGMFFGSIYNTLDHICAVNRSILTFLEGTLPEQRSPTDVVWTNWEDLKSVRLEQDKFLSKASGQWTEAWLAAKTTASDEQTRDFPAIPRWVMVVQLFNHQTHHRSQVTSELHRMGIDYGATDIPWRPNAGYFAG